MKKFLLTVLLVIALVITLVSCTDNGNENVTTAGEKATTIADEAVTTEAEAATEAEVTTVEEKTTEEATTEEATTAPETTTEEVTTVAETTAEEKTTAPEKETTKAEEVTTAATEDENGFTDIGDFWEVPVHSFDQEGGRWLNDSESHVGEEPVGGAKAWFAGWIGTSEPWNDYKIGIIVEGTDIIIEKAFTDCQKEPEDAVISAATGAGAMYATRYVIEEPFPMAHLPAGEYKAIGYIKVTDGRMFKIGEYVLTKETGPVKFEETTIDETDIAALGEIYQTTPDEAVERKALDGDLETEFVSSVGEITNYIVGFDRVYHITKVVAVLGESSGSFLPFYTTSDDLGNPGVYSQLPAITAYSDSEIEIDINDNAKYVFLGLVCTGDQYISIKELHIYTDELPA